VRLKIAAAVAGVAMSAGTVSAEIRSFSTIDLKTAAPIHWQRLPSNEDLQRYYPPEAKLKRIEGRATISCAVNLVGHLKDCHQLSDTPQGFGFGDAAVRMAPIYKLKLETSVAGEPTAPPAPVTFEVRFPLPTSNR
jgi:hypothetical protein